MQSHDHDTDDHDTDDHDTDGIRIHEVRTAGAGFDDWFVLEDQTYREVWGDDGTAWLKHELLAELTESTEEDNLALLATDATGRAVGGAWLSLPVSGNLHWADLQLFVRPDDRRRGIGTALLTDLERRAAQAGRTTLGGELTQHGTEHDPAADAFLRGHGYSPALGEIRRDLAVPVDPAVLDELEQRCLPHAGRYQIRTWTDRCPDDLVDGLARLEQRMTTDAPMGDLDVVEEPWDAARVRDNERQMRAQDRTSIVSGAVAADGTLVAFTDLRRPNAEPRRAFQWDTLVHAAHRGHRLGTLVKIATLRVLAQKWPDTVSVTTFNAGVNAPMIAVNEALGFRVAGTLTNWQKVLPVDKDGL